MWSDVAATANSIYVLTDQAVRELVRRTSVALQGVVDTEGVLSTLACDLIDGRLNGVLPRDATPVQERILMVLKAVEAKLRLELIAQNFTVNMADAYAGIDGALLAAQPENALIPTRALKVRYTALDDAVLALERVAPVEPALNELVSELEKIGNGAWAQVGTAVNTQYQALIRDTIFAIARAEDEVIGRLFRGQNINDNAVASQSQPESAGGEQSSAATPPQEVSAPTSAGQQNQESSGTETADPNPSDANGESGNGNETDSDPNVEPPTLAFVGGSDEIDIGGSVQLSWQSASADSCLADGGWSGVKAPNGSETVGPLSKSTTFRLSCEGAGGSAVVLFAVEVFKSYELSWIPPVENVDGSKVRGLSQFKIYYGTESRVYDNFIPVDGRQKSYRVSLPVGRYNFAVTAVDLEGDESQYSNEVVKD